MKLHKIQFNEILKQIKDIQVYSHSKHINFNYDNGYISYSFSFCVDFGRYDSVELYINNEKQLLTKEQKDSICKEVTLKLEEIQILRQGDVDLIKHNEIGF